MNKQIIKAYAVTWLDSDDKSRIDMAFCRQNKIISKSCYLFAVALDKKEAQKHLKESREELMKGYGVKKDIWGFKVIPCEIILPSCSIR